MILLTVQGHPRPQPRPRVFRGRAVSTADPKAKAWSDSILRAAHAAKAMQDLSGPLAVTLAFRLPTADRKRWGAPHLSVPDTDNLAKLALDAMQRAGLIANDSAVWSLVVVKTWSAPDDAGMTAALSVTAGEASAVPDAVKPPPPPEHPRWIN